jgi:hypothetical protein
LVNRPKAQFLANVERDKFHSASHQEGCMAESASHLRSVVDHDGGIILDIKSDQFFSLNPTGSLIWNHLEAGMCLDETKAAISVETGVELGVVSDDVDEFVAELKRKHLFEFSNR